MTLHYDYEIRWKNYRSFADTGWITIRPLTILIGPNSSGKSSIIAPLLLMNQTMSSRDAVTPLVTRGPLINAGNYTDFIHMRDTTKELFLGFRFHLHEPEGQLDQIGTYAPGALELTLTAGDRPEDVVLKRYELFDMYKRQYLYQYRRPNGSYTLKGVNKNLMRNNEKMALYKSKPVNFLFSPSLTLHEYYNSYGKDQKAKPSEFSEEFSQYLRTVGFTFEEFRDIFNMLSYIGPLRERPQRYYEVSGEIPRSVGTRGEHTANLLRRRFPELQKEINSWIKRFDFGDNILVNDLSEELFSLSFESKKGNTRTNIADAGFGASQVMPLVVQAMAAREESLTIAEQPEIHLNPRLQCVLADLFVEMANTDHRVIVETHSEHLLLRLRRLVASGKIDHKKIAIYFVEKTGDDSVIRPIQLEKNGHIPSDVWPKGFFGDTLQESLALATEQSRTNDKKT